MTARLLAYARGRRQAFVSARRVLALRMLWACGPGWTIGVALMVAADAVLPNLALIAMGRAVGEIPAAAAAGLRSSAGHRLLVTLAVAVAFYVASLLADPVASALNSVVRVQIDQAHKRRLMNAVSGPVGVAHLEDPAILGKLQLAQGAYMSYSPSDAPLTLASSIGNRLAGLTACVVIGTFRWWLGLGVFCAWLAVRPPLRRIVLKQIKSFRGETQQMRRAWYFLNVATQPAYAKEVRVFGLASWVIRAHRRHWYNGMAASWRGVGSLTRRVAVLFLVVLAAFGAVIAVVAWTGIHHEATLTQIATVLPILPQTMMVGSITFNDISLEWMISTLPDLHELEATLAVTTAGLSGHRSATALPERELRLDRATFRYPRASADVLTDLDLTLAAGRSTALVGVNGAGKTTLVKLICRLHDVTSGQILVDGTALREFEPRSWRRQIGAVFQDFNRYPMSAADNIAMGSVSNRGDLDGLRRAALQAGALELIEGLPDGWNTILSPQYTGGVDLSGGQWQRVALARALFAVGHGARLLILDEPTSSLDVRAEAAFFDRFLSLTTGVTSLIVSHRFGTVRQADQIVVLDRGRITERGSHQDLLAADGVYAALFRTQAAHFSDVVSGS